MLAFDLIEAARLAELEKEEGKEKRTIFPESSAAHMDGTEPIATAIVLSNPQQKMDSTSEIQSLEHLVNFAYTENCPQDTVLWPVLPLRLWIDCTFTAFVIYLFLFFPILFNLHVKCWWTQSHHYFATRTQFHRKVPNLHYLSTPEFQVGYQPRHEPKEKSQYKFF